MASIAMMPLMARFVWLLIVNPSAEDLRHRPLSIISSMSTHWDNILIIKKQRRIYQIVGPGSQKRVLSASISPCQEEIESLAYIFTYEASVPTRARIGISHNQHIPRFYEKKLIKKCTNQLSEVPTFDALIMIQVATWDIGIAWSYSKRFQYHILFTSKRDSPRSAAANGTV